MVTRKEQAERTKKRIIETAEKLIREKGYESIRITDLTKACNMSSGNFYHYFSSLDDLFETIDDIKFYESFRSLKPSTTAHVIDRINSYFYDWINLTISYYNSEYMYHWTRRYTLNPQSGSSKNRVEIIVEHLINILKDGIAKDELSSDTPIEQFAYSMAFSIFGCSAYFGITSNKELISSWQNYFSRAYITTALKPYILLPKHE